jgi:GGDEF domain-containing protein
MPEDPFGARQPPPVADVPPAALADGQAPAKGWLLQLIAARPLHDAPAVPTAELAREAPALCAAVLRAVGSEVQLPRLRPGGDLAALAAGAGPMGGAGSAAAAVAAVGHLRAALWEALLATMAPLDTATTAALAERLAFVCDVVAVASVGAAGRRTEPPGILLRDAREHAERGTEAGAGGEGAREHAEAGADAARADADATDRGDWRAADADATDRGDWRAAVGRHVREGRGFALLALEVDDGPRLLAADVDGVAAGALARVEVAVRAELRPGDVMAREDDGRLWIVAAELGASGGRALAERLADAVAGAAALRGAPLAASIGIASSPPDGTDPVALAARADEALFAARAAGVPLR